MFSQVSVCPQGGTHGRGACCMVGGMHSGWCMAWEHAWQVGGGICVAGGGAWWGACMAGVHVWQGGMHGTHAPPSLPTPVPVHSKFDIELCSEIYKRWRCSSWKSPITVTPHYIIIWRQIFKLRIICDHRTTTYIETLWVKIRQGRRIQLKICNVRGRDNCMGWDETWWVWTWCSAGIGNYLSDKPMKSPFSERMLNTLIPCVNLQQK